MPAIDINAKSITDRCVHVSEESVSVTDRIVKIRYESGLGVCMQTKRLCPLLIGTCI